MFLGKISKLLSRFTHHVPDDAPIHVNDSVFQKIGMKHDPTVSCDDELQRGLNYYFMKATEEVKKFSYSRHYEKISIERNAILYHAGRVDLRNISFGVAMTDTMIDLTSGSFDVPIVDKFACCIMVSRPLPLIISPCITRRDCSICRSPRRHIYLSYPNCIGNRNCTCLERAKTG